MGRLRRIVAALALLQAGLVHTLVQALAAPALAGEPGIGPRSILIGQSAAFSGPSGALGRE
jgi:hypothetical protein